MPKPRFGLTKFRAALHEFLLGASGRRYEDYLEHHARHHPGQPALSRSGYQESEQRRRYDGINRCC